MPEFIHIGPGPISPLATQEFPRMRDGVRLATDVYLPEGDDSPGDAILIRLPYDKNGDYTFMSLIAEYFMGRGYRVITQDVRGKFRSEGEALLFVHEAADGYDTIEWIANQRWSNGRVAMWGDSYYGFTQWAAVSAQHPALRAIAPRVTGTQLGEPVIRRAGEATSRVEWAISYMYPVTYFHSADMYLWELDPARRPFSAQIEEFFEQVGSRSISYDQWYPRPVHLNRFPFGSPFEARAIPTLHTIGWWDNCAPLSWADVAEIAKRPTWALTHFLRIESMDHEGYYLLDSPEDRTETATLEQLKAKLPQMLDPALDFFDVFVRGIGHVDDIPRVSWNLAGTDEQRIDTTWPPTESHELTLFATASGTLDEAPVAETSDLEWRHDPEDLVPSSVPNAFAFLLYHPDEHALADRPDVLVFDAPVTEKTIDLAGPVTARARAHSSGPTMDLFVRLLDVDPSGSALRIARGQVHIADATASTPLTVDLGNVGYRLAPGHHLRLHVSSSDYPEFIPQPGTGADPWSATETTPNTQHLGVGGVDGLAITLRVL